MDMLCRSCQSEHIRSVFSLGKMPLANRLLKAEQLAQAEPRYLLEIMLCEACGLVQLKENLIPNELFDEYLYFSSNSDAMVQSAAELIDSIIPNLPANARIIEIASNDGYLLQHYLKQNIQVLGIEPAKNIADYAIEKGIPTLCQYFTGALAKELVQQGIQADVIHANNVMAHIPDLNGFTKGIHQLLKPEGFAVIEVPYLRNLVDHLEFDTIYHEHVYYFSLLPLTKLFARHDLVISDVKEIPLHGGTIRLYVKHSHQSAMSKAVQDLLHQEEQLGLNKFSYYENFAARVHELKHELLMLLKSLKAQGKKIAAYGASAKGSTLLNFFGIGKEFIDYIVDRSPVKQGYYMSGTQIPIYSPDKLLQEKTPYTLLLTWNFKEEILQQQIAYRNTGGQFIVPIPGLQVI